MGRRRAEEQEEQINMDDIDWENSRGGGAIFASNEEDGRLLAEVNGIASRNTRSAREANGGEDPSKFPDDTWIKVPFNTGIFKHCENFNLYEYHKEPKKSDSDEYCAICGTNAPYDNIKKVEKRYLKQMEEILILGMREGRIDDACGEVYNNWNNVLRKETNKLLKVSGNEMKYNKMPKWSLSSIKRHLMSHINDPFMHTYQIAKKMMAIGDMIVQTSVLSVDTADEEIAENPSASSSPNSGKKSNSKDENGSGGGGGDEDTKSTTSSGSKSSKTSRSSSSSSSSSSTTNTKPRKMKFRMDQNGLKAAAMACSIYDKSANLMIKLHSTYMPKTRGYNHASASLISAPGSVISSSLRSNKTYSRRRGGSSL